jgi:hypothetical protein
VGVTAGTLGSIEATLDLSKDYWSIRQYSPPGPATTNEWIALVQAQGTATFWMKSLPAWAGDYIDPEFESGTKTAGRFFDFVKKGANEQEPQTKRPAVSTSKI